MNEFLIISIIDTYRNSPSYYCHRASGVKRLIRANKHVRGQEVSLERRLKFQTRYHDRKLQLFVSKVSAAHVARKTCDLTIVRGIKMVERAGISYIPVTSGGKSLDLSRGVRNERSLILCIADRLDSDGKGKTDYRDAHEIVIPCLMVSLQCHGQSESFLFFFLFTLRRFPLYLHRDRWMHTRAIYLRKGPKEVLTPCQWTFHEFTFGF